MKNCTVENPHTVPITNSEEFLDHFGSSYQSPTLRESYREYLSEIIGTFMFVSIGTGSIAQGVINSESGLLGSIGYGIGLTIAVMISNNVSGGHVSPAITLALACFRSFPFRKVPGYMFSQFIGAFLGAALVVLINYSKLINMNIITITSIFTTIPSSPFILVFFTQVFGTSLLLIGVQAAADQKNIPPWFFPIAVGILLVGLGLAFPGVAFNPAIDLSGRIIASLIGNSLSPFNNNPGYFIIPMFAPLLGANLGVGIYDLMVVNLLKP